jgi:SAM-dependent methyltransferase
MNEAEIGAFWDRHPCGKRLIDPSNTFAADYAGFFEEYDKFRYRTEGHILSCLDAIPFRGRRTLEIGLGQDADSEQLIRRGAVWSGLDFTAEPMKRVGLRLALKKPPFEAIRQGSALAIPFPDASLDFVYSHGVLHHIPDILRAQSEIRRVLKPDGELVVMLYAHQSLNYVLSIALLRRAGLPCLYPLRPRPNSIYGKHVENAHRLDLWRYLRMENFIHRNTDGPANPYARVYNLAAVRRDFPDFTVTRSYQRFMHAPPLPVRWLPLERVIGWHLWVHLRPVAGSTPA